VVRWRDAAIGAALCLAGAPHATAAPPLTTTQIAPGIYVHAGLPEEASAANEDAIANVGFIVGEAAVLVVDPGGSAHEGERLRAAIRQVTDRPIRWVVLTHVHPDHIFGAAAFKDDHPELVGHAKLPGALAQRGEFYLRNLRRELGEAADGSEIVAPTHLVAQSEALDLGERIVTVRAHGPAHTDTDLSLFDERTRTLFLGDLLFVERIPVLDGSIVGWLRELDALADVAAARAVPGHGPAAVDWPAALAPQRRYLREVVEGTRLAIRQGIEIGDAWRHVAMNEQRDWLLFEAYHARNVTAAFKELEWE
jgi:quinoprotein relay system zinc metallohydrolase 2